MRPSECRRWLRVCWALSLAIASSEVMAQEYIRDPQFWQMYNLGDVGPWYRGHITGGGRVLWRPGFAAILAADEGPLPWPLSAAGTTEVYQDFHGLRMGIARLRFRMNYGVRSPVLNPRMRVVLRDAPVSVDRVVLYDEYLTGSHVEGKAVDITLSNELIRNSTRISFILTGCGDADGPDWVELTDVSLWCPSFTLRAEPAEQMCSSLNAASYGVTVVPDEGFAVPVHLSETHNIPGGYCTLQPPTVAAGGSATVTVEARTCPVAGSYTIAIGSDLDPSVSAAMRFVVPEGIRADGAVKLQVGCTTYLKPLCADLVVHAASTPDGSGMADSTVYWYNPKTDVLMTSTALTLVEFIPNAAGQRARCHITGACDIRKGRNPASPGSFDAMVTDRWDRISIPTPEGLRVTYRNYDACVVSFSSLDGSISSRWPLGFFDLQKSGDIYFSSQG